MAKYDISQTLIDKLQITLCTESGLPLSHPSDQPQPPESILHDAISAVGSVSEDSVTCQGCNGELLRGIDSVICVFCGRFSSGLRDAGSSVSPICFMSLFGYQWFLKSLSLDGSEIVERPVEGGNDSGRGRSPVINEIPLSALLDLQLKWPDESNRFGVENEPGKQPAKLIGLNLDELCLTEISREDVGSSSEQKAVVSDKFVGQGSLSLFETAPKESNDGENDESDWAIEFQSANADVKVDSGLHMESTPWPLNQEESANTTHFRDLPTSVIESQSELSFDFIHSESSMIDKDPPKGLETVDASLDWLPAADKQGIDNKSDPLHNATYTDDSSNNWDGFGMFSGAENNREQINATMPVSESGGGFDINDSWNDFTGSVGAEHSQPQSISEVDKPMYDVGNQGESLGPSSTTVEVGDSFDIWNDFKSSDIRGINQEQFTDMEASVVKLPPAVDGILEAFTDTAVLSVGAQKRDADSSEADGGSSALWNDNSLDVWSDFAQSTGVPDSKPVSNETSLGAFSDFPSIMAPSSVPLQSGESKSTDNQTVMLNDDDDDDEFGGWGDFRSSMKQPDIGFREINIIGSSQDQISTGINVENLSFADKNSHNSLDDFSWSTSILNQPSHAVEAKPSESKPVSEDRDSFLGFYSGENLTSNGTVVQNDKSTNANNEEIDMWTDFTSSSNGRANNWDSSNTNAPATQEPVMHDLFDDLNVISSAPNKESGTGNGDTQFRDSTSPMYQDPFLGMLNDQNAFAEAPTSQPEMPNFARAEHQDVKESETTLTESNDQKSATAENLISEMHDLSFMLESSLSIPKAAT